jgi:hypothetical protein
MALQRPHAGFAARWRRWSGCGRAGPTIEGRTGTACGNSRPRRQRILKAANRGCRARAGDDSKPQAACGISGQSGAASLRRC